ncbi:MAG: M15 family metallopeptidase [bacterium]|nr:M15 family metallopeptidase [bacterium]
MVIRYVISLVLFSSSALFYGGTDFYGTCEKITPRAVQKMAYSWHNDSPVPLEDLRCITVSYYDFDGNVVQGELIMHALVADDIIEIFKELFTIKFPLASMMLVGDYKKDEKDYRIATNCCAHFTRRVIKEMRWSNHAFGTAIDINPWKNPYIKADFFFPPEGKKYLDRTIGEPGMIVKDSPIYKIFTQKGWLWGGECFDHCIDYMHFQKVIPGLNQNKNN